MHDMAASHAFEVVWQTGNAYEMLDWEGK